MKNETINRILSSLILIPIALFFIIKGSYFFNFFILICFLITSYEWAMMSKKKITGTLVLFSLFFLFIQSISYEMKYMEIIFIFL